MEKSAWSHLIFSVVVMKFTLIIFLFAYASFAFAGNDFGHYISLNIYINDNGEKFPLFETQKITKSGFDILATQQDDIFSKYSNKFYDIKYIEVIIPNKVNSLQEVTIGFKNKKIRNFIINSFLNFSNFNDKTKIFTTDFLVSTRNRLEIPDTFFNNQNSANTWNYVEISKIN